jgi:hypothetical protein
MATVTSSSAVPNGGGSTGTKLALLLDVDDELVCCCCLPIGGGATLPESTVLGSKIENCRSFWTELTLGGALPSERTNPGYTSGVPEVMKGWIAEAAATDVGA